MGYWDESLSKEIVGKKVRGVYMDSDRLIFDTDQGHANFYVTGDCCSSSSFHDFLGVPKLISGGPVLSVKEVEASELCKNYHHEWDDSVVNYGYEFVVESPEFGEVTAVVSFRNNSNGYYGGEMVSGELDRDDAPDLVFVQDDILEVTV